MAEAKHTQPAAGGETLEMGDFATLLKKEFRPQTDSARQEVESAVHTLAEHALAGTKLIGNDVVTTIDALVAAIDKKLSDQMNVILHNQEFQQLEGAWRGLHYLVNNTES